MDGKITMSQLMDALVPTWIALHERGLIPLQEMALQYEDALARRRLEKGESEESTAFLQALVVGLHRLAAAHQERERAQTKAPPGSPTTE